jgi:hypothetical protein
MLPNTSFPEQNTQKTDEITYKTSTSDGMAIFAAITAGDSITASNGGTAITDLYPNNWLKDTVVVSNELNAIGTNATIKFTPPQLIYGNPNPTTTFEFVKEENKQYYPSRKADTVNTISTATDLNFLANGVENIRGSAALNLYQLESNPLVARISTVNAIGETTGQMIPFLSVYETKPIKSQLEIFWETASTGLISDLNDDVLTGFDGPVGFTSIGYRHFEDQNPSQTGTGTGNPDSAYITNAFTAVNNQGSPLVGTTTLTLTSVVDGATNARLSDFELEATGPSNPGEYRLKIVENPSIPFVFNRNAETLQSYTFNIEVSFDSQGQTLTETLPITGRLGNIQPIIVGGCDSYSVTIDQQASAVATINAENGAFQSSGANVQSDIFYEILTGGQYFNIDQSGNITVDLPTGTPALPIGVYTLNVRVTDAYNVDALTTGLSNEFNSISTDCVSQSVVITVGQEKTPPGFHIDQADIFSGYVYNYRGFQGTDPTQGFYQYTFDPTDTGFGKGGFGLCGVPAGGNDGVVRMCATDTVSNRIARPTTLGGSISTGASGNVKFAVLYMGPRGININIDPLSNNMGKNSVPIPNTELANLPLLPSTEVIGGNTVVNYTLPLNPNGSGSLTNGGPFAAGINAEVQNGSLSPEGLISGQVLITNKVIANGDWSNSSTNFNRGTLDAGRVELDYKIYRRGLVTDLITGETDYASNNASWVQVSDVNKSVPTSGWGNACTGSTANGNNLFAKVQFSDQTQAGEARVASREDSFVLDGTALPGEYCIIYRFTNTPFQAPLTINSPGGVWYPTGESNGGTMSVGIQDLNFKYDGAVPTGELRFAPTTNPAQFSVNPSYSNSVSGAFPVGYNSQFTTTAPFDQTQKDKAKVPFQNYVLAQTASVGDDELVFTAASITSNGISPYLNLDQSVAGIQADTFTTIINVGGDVNKVKLSKQITSSIPSGTTISIGRTVGLLNPFTQNANTTLYSTVGRVNTVSQFFYDPACTNVFSIINNDNSESLFKLYNQRNPAPNYLNYSTAFNGGIATPPTGWDNLMPLPSPTPIASVRLDADGNVVNLGPYSSSGNGDRGLSPIAQELNA